MIQLTREIRLFFGTNIDSSSHVINSWAGKPSALIAPFLRLRGTLEGEIQTRTGYLCDIKIIDDMLVESALPVVQQMAHSRENATTSCLLLAIAKKLFSINFPDAKLVRLQLADSPYQYYEIDRTMDMIRFTEQFEFSAAHRLHSAELTDEENRSVFGKCNNANGHGHNYVLEVTVVAPQELIAKETTRHRLEEVVKSRVIDRFDHKHLNEDTEEFRTLNPTVENITRVIWQLLNDSINPLTLANVRVYETPKTWADYTGNSKTPQFEPLSASPVRG